MDRKKFYDEIYKCIIQSIHEFEDDDDSEWYDCLYHYFLDQYKIFDFANERCFRFKSTSDRVAKLYFQKIVMDYFLFSWKGMKPAFIILFHFCLPENNLNFRQNVELK